jgi:hypothetical protein
MGIYLSLIVGLVLWLVLWGTNLMKGFDSLLIALLFPLLAATATIVVRYLPRGND